MPLSKIEVTKRWPGTIDAVVITYGFGSGWPSACTLMIWINECP